MILMAIRVIVCILIFFSFTNLFPNMPIHLEDITELVRLLLVTVSTDGLDEELRMNSSIPFLSSDVQTLPEIHAELGIVKP